MGYSKVDYNGETLMDISNDTVTPETLVEDATAHNANGDPITGIAKAVTDGLLLTPLTTNGTHETKGFSHVEVNVPGQYYATTLAPSSDALTASFRVGFEPRLFMIVPVNYFDSDKNSSQQYIGSYWHAEYVDGVGAEHTGIVSVYKNGNYVRANAVSGNNRSITFYDYANGTVTIKSTGYFYFKSGITYRVVAMA